MKKIFCLVLFYFHLSQGQNLVPNASFENYWQCPTHNSFVGINDWYKITNSSGTPDYFNSCSQLQWNDVPTNAFGSQAAYTGDAYIGLWCYNGLNPNAREYVQVQLSSPMISGQIYYVSFFVSLADDCQYSINNLGAVFTNVAIGGNGNLTNINIVPHINFPTIISDKENWTQISGTYQAIGGEQFLTLGNFYNDEQTSKTFTPVFGGFSHSYYYFDNVIVSTEMLANLEISVKDQLEIYPNPFTEVIHLNIENIQQVTIYSFGQVVKNVHGDIKEIDLSDWSRGIYFISVKTTDNRVLTKKIVKK